MHRAFWDAGFYRILQPRRFGGYQFSVETFFRVIMEIAQANTGTGWNLSLGAAHTLQVCAYFSERAQAEAFGADGFFSAPHRAAAVGRATPVDGGWVIDGRWEYASGITHATHFIASSMGPDPAGGPDLVLAPLVPRAAVRVLDDWGGEQSLGLRSSGRTPCSWRACSCPRPPSALAGRGAPADRGRGGARHRGRARAPRARRAMGVAR